MFKINLFILPIVIFSFLLNYNIGGVKRKRAILLECCKSLSKKKISLDDIDKLKLLIEVDNRLSINSRDINGCTLLHHAINFNKLKRLEIIKLLLNNGADVNAKNNNNLTPLAKVFIPGSFNRQVVFELFYNKADINIKDNRGFNLLMQNAALLPHERGVRLLLELGCKVDLNTQEGRFLLSLLRWSNNYKAIDLIKIINQVEFDLNLFKYQSQDIQYLLVNRWRNINLFQKPVNYIDSDKNTDSMSLPKIYSSCW